MTIMRIRQGINLISILRTSFFCFATYSTGSIASMRSNSSNVGGSVLAMVNIMKYCMGKKGRANERRRCKRNLKSL